jgi:predicted metal-dependent hydrolase
MSVGKKEHIEKLIQRFRGLRMDAHYLGYFECFNQQSYYEAHEVLEKLWLGLKNEPDGNFYKGLIQLAGAFVHLQKNRSQPALSLLLLAENNLKRYPDTHHSLNLRQVFALIEDWRSIIQASPTTENLLSVSTPPKVVLADN